MSRLMLVKKIQTEYDETNIGIRDNLIEKLGGDEPYYLNNEASTLN